MNMTWKKHPKWYFTVNFAAFATWLLALAIATLAVIGYPTTARATASDLADNSAMPADVAYPELLKITPRSTFNPKVTEFLANHKVYISLTTSPKRIAHLAEVFRYLDLTHVEAILLCIPHKYARDNSEYVIPTNLVASYPKLKIIRVAKDLGPITKLLPAIKYVNDLGQANAIVITIDDDMAYSHAMVNELIHYAINNDAIVGGVAYNIGQGATKNIDPKAYPWTNANSNNRIANFINHKVYWREFGLKQRQFVAGFGAIAYQSKFIDYDTLLRLSQLNTACFKSDDAAISYYLNANKVKIAKVSNKKFNINNIISLEHGLQSDALHQLDVNEEKFGKCCSDLVSEYKI
jgi:hypothetical protein